MITRHAVICCAALGAAGLLPMSAAGAVLHVNHTAPPGGDGSTWASAYVDLTDALAAAASGDEIWVAEGTHHAAGPGGDRAATFALTGGVALYGGFAGGETSRDQRDPAAHITLLSGDLNEDDGDPQNGPWANMSDNSYHVVTAIDVTPAALIDGFTITRGWSWQSSGSNSAGAGLFVTGSELEIVGCTVTANLSHSGAGLYSERSTLSIDDCSFNGNYASDGRGGAIYHTGDYQMPGVVYTMTITGSRFSANVADVGAGPGDAGAIWSSFDAPIDVSTSLFEHNRAKWRFTSASMAANAGAVLIFGAGSRVDRCVFFDNSAHVGGALWIGRAATVTNCLFIANEAFRQSAGAYDYGGYAGTIYVPAGPVGDVVIDNCTLHANTARSVGGIIGGANTTVVNSVLWTNTSTEKEATLLDEQIGGDMVLRYSCIRGLLEPIPGEDPPNPENTPGCIDVDPLLVDPAGLDNVVGTLDDDVRLAAGSPAIDAGECSAVPGWALLDLDGAPRLADDPATTDTGTGGPPVVDMGAWEFGAAAPHPGDATGDGVVNVDDLVAVILAWGACPGCAADLNGDGDVDVDDLVSVIVNWG